MRTPLGGCFCKSYLLCESASFGHHFCLSVEDRDGISIHHGEVTFYLIPVSFYLRDFLETDIDISWNNCAVCQDTIIVSIATKRKSSNNVFEQYRAITSLKSKSQHTIRKLWGGISEGLQFSVEVIHVILWIGTAGTATVDNCWIITESDWKSANIM